MAKRPRNRSERPSHPPLWLVEGLDIVSRKRTVLAAVVLAVVLVGALAALLFPGVVPRTPEVGAAIGLAALLLGLAAAVATDATDLIVRGPRHVAAAGGELVAVLPRDPSVASAGPLATAVLEVREPGVPLLLALATAGRDARRSNAWTDAIARALVADGVGVLRVDLASGRSEQAGLVEVVRDGLRLADAASFEPGLKLAQLSAGRDHAEALVALTELPGRLPRDLDIMLVSLPTAASRSVVAAATALDHVLVVVERDRTSRVDLIASLDALEAAGTHAQAVLLDTQTALRLAPPIEAAAEPSATKKRTISSTVGAAPVVAPGADDEPVAVPDGEGGPSGEATDEQPADDDLPGAASSEDGVPPADDVRDEVTASGSSDDEVPTPGDRDDAEVDASAPLAGPLAAGVAGAGLTAGLGAIASEREEGGLDDAAPDAEEDPVAEADAGPQIDPGQEADAGPQVDPTGEGAGRSGVPASEPRAEDVVEDAGDTEPAAEARDVELLEAAAAATAMSIADAEDEPLDEHFDALPASHDLEDELTQPDAAPLVEEIVELPADDPHPEPDASPEPADADGGGAPAGADLEDDDPTDRLPPVVTADVADTADTADAPGAADATDGADPAETPEPDLFAAGDEDLLRTTAQLAMLADDLALRGPGDAGLDASDLDQPERDEHDGRA